MDYPQLWKDRVGAFAAAVGIEIEKINEAFKPLVGEPSEEAAVIIENEDAVSNAEIKEALKDFGIPSGKLNMHLAKLRPEKIVEEAVPAEKAATSSMSLSILPAVPSDDSFLEALKTGGVLKIGETEVLAAIKAALAQKVGLFQIPDKILEKMESFAIAQEQPNGEGYYAIQKLVTEKKYGDVLSIINVSGSYISEGRKKAFFEKLNLKLWPALNDFQNRLITWRQAWAQGMADPGMLFMAMAAGKSGNMMPPGMMAPPDTTDLHAAAEEVINEINRVFAGPGIPVARALAYDATRIMKILENKDLPTQTGAANKDQMIKELGITVGAEIVRVEQSLTRYALAIMSLGKVTPGDDELFYFSAMFQLGSTIPWDKLVTKGLGARDLRN
jgi:hypothetical protein